MALIQGLVDTQKQNLKSLGVVNAGDSLEIQLEVKERGGDIEFVNPIFELLAIKSDGTRVRQLVNIRYVGNIVIIEGDEQLVSCPGVVSLQLIINDNKRMSTCLFYFMCGKSFDRDIIQSIDKVGVLQELDSYVITMFSNLKEFEERIIEVDKTIRKLSEDMNEAEKVRGAAETKRQETFQAKQEEREKEYQESKLDKDNDYNLAEKNRDNLYKDAESSRNQLYLNEKSDRNNKFEQEKDDRKLEFNTLKAKMEEATNNSKNEENRRALTFTDLREAMEHLKSTMIENNNVMVNNESGRVAAETKRVADFNKMKEDNTTLGNNLTQKVDNKIIEIEKINEDFKKNISAQYEDIVTEFDKVIANVTNGNENATNSEIVQARGKEVNLNARLDNFDEQLEQTVRKGEGGSVTWAMASQDFRENVTGGNTAVVGKDSVLKENIVDGEVIKSKASFYKKTRNLFDKEKAIYGKYVSSTTGELTTPSVEGTFYASDYVEVINGSKYNYRAKDNSYTLYAFYNNDKQFINGGNSNGTDIISPVDGFIRVSVWKNVDVDTVQFELGDATEYIEPYILEVEEEVANIKPKIEKVLENQVDYSDCNRNKFNPNIAIINKQVSPSNGSIIDVTAEGIFYASEMINVKGHEKINCIKNDFTTMYSTYAFYDVNGGFVSGGSGEINGIDIPSNATGFKFTVWKNILPENIMIELDGLNSFIRFDDDSRNQEVYLTKMKFKDIIINCIGDSITYGFLTSDTRMQSPYPSSLKSLLGAKEVRNYGLSGTTVANDRTVIGSFEPMSSPTRVETWDNNANVNIVLGGVNDFIKNVELGTIDDEVDTTFYGGYKSLIRQLYKKYPNKKIVIMTPLHYNLEYTPNSKGYILKDYVNAIREIAEMFGIYLIDLYAICDININTRGKYQIDGLHTNQFYVSNIMTPLIADGLNRAIQ